MSRNLMMLVALVCFGATEAHAHHNAASHYRLDESIEVEGVVTNFRMINPHVQIHLDVKGKDGKTEKWLLEGNSVGVVTRSGWDKNELMRGEHIRAKGRPARDPSKHLLLWTTITKDDGTVHFGGNSIPAYSEGVSTDTRQHIEELRKRQIEERNKKQTTAPDASSAPPEKPQKPEAGAAEPRSSSPVAAETPPAAARPKPAPDARKRGVSPRQLASMA